MAGETIDVKTNTDLKADPKELAVNISKDFDNAEDTFAQFRMWTQIEKFNKTPELRKQTIDELKTLGLAASYEKQRTNNGDVMQISISKPTAGQVLTIRFKDIDTGRSNYHQTEISNGRREVHSGDPREQMRQAFELYVREREPNVSNGVFQTASAMMDLSTYTIKDQLPGKNVNEAAKLLNSFFGKEILEVTEDKNKIRTLRISLDKDTYLTYGSNGLLDGKLEGKDINTHWSSTEEAGILQKARKIVMGNLALDENSAAQGRAKQLAQIEEKFGKELANQINSGWKHKATIARSSEEIQKAAKQVAEDVCRASDPYAQIRLQQVGADLTGSFLTKLDLLPKLAELGVKTTKTHYGFSASANCLDGDKTVKLYNTASREYSGYERSFMDFSKTETPQSKGLAALQSDMNANTRLKPESQNLALSIAKVLLTDNRDIYGGSTMRGMEQPVKGLLSLPTRDAEELVSYLNKALETNIFALAQDNSGSPQLIMSSGEKANVIWNQNGKIESATVGEKTTKDVRYLFDSSKTRDNADLADTVASAANLSIVQKLAFSENSIVSRLDKRREELAGKLMPELEKTTPSAEQLQSAFALANPDSDKMSAADAEQMRKSIMKQEIHAVASGLRSEADLKVPSLMSMYASIVAAPTLNKLASIYENDAKLKADISEALDRDYFAGKKVEEIYRLHKRLFAQPNSPVTDFFGITKSDFRSTESIHLKLGEAVKGDMKANTDISSFGQAIAADLLSHITNPEAGLWSDRAVPWGTTTLESNVKALLHPPLGTARDVVAYLNKSLGKELFAISMDSSGNPQLNLQDGQMKVAWNKDGLVQSASMDTSKNVSMWDSFWGESTQATAEKVRRIVGESLLKAQASEASLVHKLEQRRQELASRMLPELENRIPSVETIQKEFEIANNNDKISREDAEHLRQSIINYAVYLAASGAKPESLEKSPKSTYSFSSILTAAQLKEWQPYAEQYVVDAKTLAKRFKLSAELAEKADKLERLHRRLFPTRY